eukprot:SAG31_NODE_6717_length_1912_cov_29.734694_3_plen_86_part_00
MAEDRCRHGRRHFRRFHLLTEEAKNDGEAWCEAQSADPRGSTEHLQSNLHRIFIESSSNFIALAATVVLWCWADVTGRGLDDGWA